MDETTAPVLDPGRGVTKTEVLWALARDDRPWGVGQGPAGRSGGVAVDSGGNRLFPGHDSGMRRCAALGLPLGFGAKLIFLLDFCPQGSSRLVDNLLGAEKFQRRIINQTRGLRRCYEVLCDFGDFSSCGFWDVGLDTASPKRR